MTTLKKVEYRGKTFTFKSKVDYKFALVWTEGILSKHKTRDAAMKSAKSTRAYFRDYLAFVEGKPSQHEYSVSDEETALAHKTLATLKIVEVE